MSNSRRLPVAIVQLAVAAAAHADANTEKIFADAGRYTVYVETRIDVPFIEDEAGSFIGAGFVVNRQQRWIVTNAHVSGKSPAEISVHFRDGTEVDAAPVYIDPYLDLAVLAFGVPGAFEFAEAELDCEATPGIGHPVGTFGHPEGLHFTGTRGIISGRTSQYGAEWLQTDAPISSGNSGGPLISLNSGRVVGINSAIVDEENTQNTNLAVPMTHVCRILELMTAGEDPRPPDIGVSFFEYEGTPTLVVGQVYERGERLGLKRGDHIYAIAGKSLRRATEGELIHRLRGRMNRVELELMRAGESMRIVGDLPPWPNVMDRRGVYINGALFALSNLRDIATLKLELPVMVHWVQAGTAADAAGMTYYDHVVAIDGQLIKSLDDLQRLVQIRGPDKVVALDLLRFADGTDRIFQDVIAEMRLDDMRLIAFPR